MDSISLRKLINYIEEQDFSGWDPYDTLNCSFNIRLLGKYAPALAIQVQKRNPINIRPILGIKKGINPKGMGLMLKAYSILYKKTGEKRYLDKATWIFGWLKDNYSLGYSGYAWGYNFDWASSESFLKAYVPSVVVTSFITDGIFEYFQITKDKDAKFIILSAAKYVKNDIPILEFDDGIAFSYTHQEADCCYNASLLAAEILARANHLEPNQDYVNLINKAVEFVIAKQNDDGSWFYSYNPRTQTERKQIDFHQGFVLVSLYNLSTFLSIQEKTNSSIHQGLLYYRQRQFETSGRSLWRIPKRWPVDIHNQSQGIITLTLLKDYDGESLLFARTIASWTIKKMQSRKGYFYYRRNFLYTNKIPYMRWGQAWMLLALATVFNEGKRE